ncbi:MAG: D-alanine--D-alanine ligase family protein [Candidatus Faecimonas sp.]|nr:D-alanine--D-alanine ligase family protein [Candidatus Faecimonas sp.]
MKIKVGVIFGGESVEHEVSVISAMQAMNKLDQEKYEIIPIYITKDREWYTGEMLKDIEVYQDLSLIKKYGKNVVLYYRDGSFVLQKKSFPRTIVGEVDIVLPVVHGTNVEDGGLQGYLQTIGVPFVGSDVYASVVGQDKVFMKDIWKNAKLPMTDYVWFYDIDYKQDRDEVIKKVEKLSYPVIVKPATTGSSVGIAVCGNREELVSAIDDAIQYDKKILVEEVVQNLKEVNIAVMGNYEHQKVSEIEEVLSANKFLTYADKYIGDGKGKLKGVKAPVKGASKGMASANRKLPAELSEKVRKEVEDVAREAFRALGSSGNSRIDFLVDEKTNKVYINEINSIPGSLAFYLWEAKEIDFSTVLDEMINIGVKDYKKKS